MLSFLLSNCNYSARFSFFSSFCNFLLCCRFVYIPAGIYAKKRARILVRIRAPWGNLLVQVSHDCRKCGADRGIG